MNSDGLEMQSIDLKVDLEKDLTKRPEFFITEDFLNAQCIVGYQ
jgi:hypothetical protein